MPADFHTMQQPHATPAFDEAWRDKLARAHRTRDAFDAARAASPKWFKNLSFPLFAAARANHWTQNVLDNWEPWYACDHDERVPALLHDGPKWMCGAAYHPAPCTLVSLGSNFDDRFERAMYAAAGCRSYIVDPTLAQHPKKLNAFSSSLAASIGASVNASFGVGKDGDLLNIMGMKSKTPLLGLRRLLIERYPGPTRHVSVLKVDVEGAEYDVLRDAYRMCADGELSVDQLVVEFHAGLALKSGKLREYTVRDLYDAFANASRCDLMLHHKERNGWGCDGFACIEFSWVSATHARRTMLRSWGESAAGP